MKSITSDVGNGVGAQSFSCTVFGVQIGATSAVLKSANFLK